MSRKTIALLGLGVVLLFAVPILGTIPARAVSTLPEKAAPEGAAQAVSVPGFAAQAKAAPITTTETNGYKLVVLPPIVNRNDFYGGSTIPVKFQLFDSNGNPVTDATATLWVNGMAATASGSSNQGNAFRYDPMDMMYAYNLNTKTLPAGPGLPTSTITIKVVVGTTTLMQDFVVSLD